MRRTMMAALVAVACVGGLAVAQEKPAAESAEALRKLMQDTVAAAKAGDAKKVMDAAKGLALPGAAAWFKKVFGEEKGAALAAEYAKSAERLPKEMNGLMLAAAAQGQTEITVIRFDKGGDLKEAAGLQKQALAAMKEPVALYTVKFVKAEETAGLSVWSFVYVDGGFRLAGKMRAVR